MGISRWLGALVFIGICGPLSAQDPPEKERVLCDPAAAENGCPGADCICAPDTLEVTFDGDTDGVFEYDTFQEGMTIDVTIVTDTVSEKVQGWSYGVAHDPGAIQINEATTGGTDVEGLFIFVEDFDPDINVETCGDDVQCAPENRTPGGGWISAVVLDFRKTTGLRIERNTLARARYTLKKDVGPEGTLIQFSDRLARPLSPPTDLNLTTDGRSKLWSTAVDGWVKRKGEAPAFRRGDADGNGDIDILDVILGIRSLFRDWKLPADCDDAVDSNDDGKLSILDTLFTLAYVFQQGPAFPAPFPDCGPDPTPDAVPCREPGCVNA